MGRGGNIVNDTLQMYKNIIGQIEESLHILQQAIDYIFCHASQSEEQLAILPGLISQMLDSANIAEQVYPQLSVFSRLTDIQKNILYFCDHVGDNANDDRVLEHISNLIQECQADLSMWSSFIMDDPEIFHKELANQLISLPDPHSDNEPQSRLSVVIEETEAQIEDSYFIQIRDILPVDTEVILVTNKRKDALFNKKLNGVDKIVDYRENVSRDLLLMSKLDGSQILLITEAISLSQQTIMEMLHIMQTFPDLGCIMLEAEHTYAPNIHVVPHMGGKVFLFPHYLFAVYLLSKDIAPHFRYEACSAIFRRSGKAMVAYGCAECNIFPLDSLIQRKKEMSLETCMEYYQVFDTHPFDNDLIPSLDLSEYIHRPHEAISILALNSGICATALSFKNALISVGCRDVTLFGACLSDSAIRYEMNGICDGIIQSRSWAGIKDELSNCHFDYIFIGNFPPVNRVWSILPDLKNMLNPSGILFVNHPCMGEQQDFKDTFQYRQKKNEWEIFDSASFEQSHTRDNSIEYFSGCRKDLINLLNIEAKKDEPFRVLELGCGAGSTLAWLKYCYPKCNTYGLEINPYIARTAKERIDYLFVGDCEELELPGTDNSFDFIICGDVIEHLVDPWKLVERVRNRLKPGGQIAVSIPNVQHWSIILDLIQGNWNYSNSGILDRTHLRFFTVNTIVSLFQNAGFTVEKIGANIVPSQYSTVVLPNEATSRVEVGLNELYQHSWSVEHINYDVHQCLLVASKPNEDRR